MPGIITHKKVFTEALTYLGKEKSVDPYNKSILSLFKSEAFLKSGLFGSIGPNIFDYLPFLKKHSTGGSRISYELHSSGCCKFLTSLVSKILSNKDQNNEWSALQKAYLYGFISHIVSDSIFHPYVYYWCGFSNSNRKSDLSHFRQQFLLFEYNMDLYFSQRHDQNNSGIVNNFEIKDMLPTGKKSYKKIEDAILSFLLNSLKNTYTDSWGQLIKNNNINNNTNSSLLLNLIPIFIKLSYKIKRSRNPKLLKILNYLKRKNFFYSDYFVNYPSPVKLNTHILNLHKERWYHPAGVSGLHYESVSELLSAAASQTSVIWKKIEGILHSEKKDVKILEDELKINAIIGVFGKDFNCMQIQNSVHPRF